jgi:hypothetical protein
VSLLRKYIRHIILEDADDSDDKDGPPDDLLTEPDFIEDPDEEGEDIRKEISAISTGGGAMTSTNAIGGATTPMGTGPTYPSKKKKKKRKRKGKYPTYGTLSSDD